MGAGGLRQHQPEAEMPVADAGRVEIPCVVQRARRAGYSPVPRHVAAGLTASSTRGRALVRPQPPIPPEEAVRALAGRGGAGGWGAR